MKFEKNNNLKPIKYTLYATAVIGVVFALITKPNSQNLTDANNQIQNLDSEIVKKKISAENNSPYQNKFDLKNAENKAAKNLGGAIAEMLSKHSLNQKDIKLLKQKWEAKAGKQFTEKYAESHYLKQGHTEVYFKNTNNVQHAKILVLGYFWYPNEDNKPAADTDTWIFDYDLVNGKVNNCKEQSIVDSY